MSGPGKERVGAGEDEDGREWRRCSQKGREGGGYGDKNNKTKKIIERKQTGWLWGWGRVMDRQREGQKGEGERERERLTRRPWPASDHGWRAHA